MIALLTLAAVAINGVALWGFRDSWLAIFLCTILFYGGAYGVCTRYALRSRWALPPGRRLRSLALGAVSALAVSLLTVSVGSIYFQKAMPPETLNQCAQRILQSRALRFGLLPFVIWVSLILPIGEEMYWRGGLLGMVRSHLGFGPALLLSALCFTAYHLVTVLFFLPTLAALPFILSVFLGGLIFAWMTEYTGNIWAAAICHGPGVWGGTLYLMKRFLI